MATQNETMLSNYDEWSKRMIGDTYVNTEGETTDTVQKKALDTVLNAFSTYGIDNTMLGEILSNAAIQTAVAFNKDAITASLSAVQEDTSLAKTNSDIALNVKRGLLVDRQKKGFDDNLFVKDVEFQASLASFATNAGSLTAQDTIDDLKLKMTAMIGRATV